MTQQNKRRYVLASTSSTTAESFPWKKHQCQQKQIDQKYLYSINERLEDIIKTLLQQLTEMQNKYTSQEKKLLKQIQQKDKLIFSLTSINNNLIKQNSRMKKKSEAQFQYFVKRITETQYNALNEKKSLQQTIQKLKATLANQVENLEEYSQKNKKLILCTTTFGSNIRQNKNQAQTQKKLIQNRQIQAKTHKRTYTNTQLAANNQGVQIRNMNNVRQKKKIRKWMTTQLTLSRINPERQLIQDEASFI